MPTSVFLYTSAKWCVRVWRQTAQSATCSLCYAMTGVCRRTQAVPCPHAAAAAYAMCKRHIRPSVFGANRHQSPPRHAARSRRHEEANSLHTRRGHCISRIRVNARHRGTGRDFDKLDFNNCYYYTQRYAMLLLPLFFRMGFVTGVCHVCVTQGLRAAEAALCAAQFWVARATTLCSDKRVCSSAS